MLPASNEVANLFLSSSSLNMNCVVSAEWNQNIYNPPYVVVSGTGEMFSSTNTPTLVTRFGNPTFSQSTTEIKNGFSTWTQHVNASASSTIQYTMTGTNPGGNLGAGESYKVVFYAKTDSIEPILLSSTIRIFPDPPKISSSSASYEITSLEWTRIEFSVSWNSSITPQGIQLAINSDMMLGSRSLYEEYDYPSINLFITDPEFYKITKFDHEQGSLWPTYSVFEAFRPGESLIGSAASGISIPERTFVGGHSGSPQTVPVSPLTSYPELMLAKNIKPLQKNYILNSDSQYKYFLSSKNESKRITAKYKDAILSNKIVIKLNTIMSSHQIQVALDGVSIGTFTADTSGVIKLYYNSSNGSWGTSNIVLPIIDTFGQINQTIPQFYTISVWSNSSTIDSSISSLSLSTDNQNELKRLSVIEISPRLELDLSNYVESVEINKSLDSATEYVPISSINSNDANIKLSNIPALAMGGAPTSIFSGASNNTFSALSGMIGRNIKFYIKYIVNNGAGSIPGGVFYSDSWSEDSDSVTIQAYDITRHLQTVPVADYVADMQTPFEIISNILDLSGFTDYDYDKLYQLCKGRTYSQMDMSYFYCNSKDSTVLDILSQIFLAYQIGAYIDEYGIMRFTSISSIISNTTENITLSDSSIIDGGYSLEVGQKPGKVSVRYQPPKIKQSLSMQNAQGIKEKQSPSFIMTTSNDVLWSQQNVDSVGFNYLYSSMAAHEKSFTMNVNDLLDIFHTFDMNHSGYVIIEDEVVSFRDKEYTISGGGGTTRNVVIKNSIDLSSELSSYIKDNYIGLVPTIGDTPTTDPTGIDIVPTGRIMNVHRGMFNTTVADHQILTGASAISTKNVSSYTEISGSTTNAVASLNQKIAVTALPSDKKVIVYPTNKTDLGNVSDSISGKYLGFQTYLTKFVFGELDNSAAGLFFNKPTTINNFAGTYYVEVLRIKNSESSNYEYWCTVYQNVSGTDRMIATTNITSTVNSIYGNMPKVLKKVSTNPVKYVQSLDITTPLTLKVTHYQESSSEGNTSSDSGRVIRVFLNNVEVSTWQIPPTAIATITNAYAPGAPSPVGDVTYIANNSFQPGDYVAVSGIVPDAFNLSGLVSASTSTSFTFYGYTGFPTPLYESGGVASLSSTISQSLFSSLGVNVLTGMPKSLTLPNALSSSPTKFGAYATTNTISFYGNVSDLSGGIAAEIAEIYACQTPLKENAVNYYFQDRRFLNAILQKQNPVEDIYSMQTVPEIIGINIYDVDYSTPAAVSADILPIEYMWHYFPSDLPEDQAWLQAQLVPETGLAYSTVINTGFRGKVAIANSSPHMVFLSKEADSVNQFTVRLNLWTHEIITTSDQENIELIVDKSNPSMVAQIDSEWIQSKTAAERLLKLIGSSIDNFSKTTTLKIFGNPLIQVGDVINLSYSLANVNQQKCVVHSVSHSFDGGLETTLILKTLKDGVSYIGSEPYAPTIQVVSSETVVPRPHTYWNTPSTILSLTGGYGVDDGYYTINLPYAIKFNGTFYNTITVGTNSFIEFGTETVMASSIPDTSQNPPFPFVTDTLMLIGQDMVVDSVRFEYDFDYWSLQYTAHKYGMNTGQGQTIWKILSDSYSPEQLILSIEEAVPESTSMSGIYNSNGVKIANIPTTPESSYTLIST